MKIKYTFIFLISFLIIHLNIYAFDNVTDNESNEILEDSDSELFLLDTIDVIQKIGDGSDSGKTEISREIIDYLPSGNQGITDMLKIAPGVQFNENYKSSSTAGEIKPANISISGAKTYENLYLIDGMSNSSLLDPGGYGNLLNDVEGEPQKFFINQWLIEDITLLDSDISASYNGFQGGVVDVKLKQPVNIFQGNFNYKVTNQSLTNFFISEEAKRSHELGSFDNQLLFEKHFLSLGLNIPITKNYAFLFSANYNWSKIPLMNLSQWNTQTRNIQNYFLKSSWKIDSSSYVDASISYSPYIGNYFLKNKKDSDYKVINGGTFAVVNYVKEYNGHKFKVHGDLNYSENKKFAPDEYKVWNTTDKKNWGKPILTGLEGDNFTSLSIEGGLGDVEKYETSVKISFDHNVKPIEIFGKLKINYGLEYSAVFGRYLKRNNSYWYDGAYINPLIDCKGDSNTCSEGDQYFTERTITPSSDVNAFINHFGTYLEGDYTLERFNLRLGVRYDIDDYLKNSNFSPRVKATLDLFNNKKTTINAGYGRYYSSSMLFYKLREGRKENIKEVRWSYRNKLKEWVPSNLNTKTTYNFNELKTPYNDEVTVSLNQDILGSFVNLKYLLRYGKDAIATNRLYVKDGIAYYSFNNNGYSNYSSLQLKWQKSWKNHHLITNLTWSTSEVSNESYDESLDIEDMEKEVIYNGNKILLHDLPKGNYARPLIFNISYIGTFFKNLKLSLTLNYKSPYKSLELTGFEETGEQRFNEETNEIENVTYSTYEDVYYGHNVTVDLGLYWEQTLWKTHKLTIFTEIYNLFNTQNQIGKRFYTGDSSEDYELGLQVWFGVQYEF